MTSVTINDAIQQSRIQLLKLQSETLCPGLTVAVSLDGQQIWSDGFGYSDVENSVPCVAETVMKIASISKPITAAVLARVLDSKVLDLDKDIRSYVDYWPTKFWSNQEVSITTRQLASHTSGVRDYKKLQNNPDTASKSGVQPGYDYEEYFITKHFDSVAEAVGLFKDDPLLSSPGSQFTYTNHGFTLLSAVLEGATGSEFTALLRKLLLEARMENTYVDEQQRLISARSRHYVVSSSGEPTLAPYTESSFKIAGAGLLSTAPDLVVFGNAMLYSYQSQDNPGCAPDPSEGDSQSKNNPAPLGHLPAAYGGYSTPPGDDTGDDTTAPKALIKQSTIETFWTPVDGSSISWDPNGRYAMGWQIVPDDVEEDKFYAGHTGRTVGASCALIVAVDKRWKGMERGSDGVGSVGAAPRGAVVAVLCNAQGVSVGRLAVDIAKRFEGTRC